MWRSSSLIFSLIFIVLPKVQSISFKLSGSDFNSSQNILFHGDAAYSNGTVELNLDTYEARVGHMVYAKRIHLWDNTSGRVSDFSTHFSFEILTPNVTFYGDGLAFFIAPFGFQIPLNSAFGFLGLFNTTTARHTSSNQVIAVAFDTHPDPIWDPPYAHVGINVNSINYTVYTRLDGGVRSGNITDVWIFYNGTTKNLSVFWSYRDQNFGQNSSLFLKVDLKKIIPEWASIGFSASTGKAVERHIIHSWEFCSNLDIIEKVPLNDIGTIKFIVSLIIPLCGVGICFFLGLVIFFLRRWKHRKMKKVEETLFNNEVESGVGPRRFYYSELDLATNNFSLDNRVGQGGFGAVYKGYMPELKMAIAVKKFLRGSKQGKKEYITEVKIISGLRHRNLVQLIGWCHDKGELLVVYEFLPNGSLDTHLFGPKAPLSWPTRYKIALGLASGLLYLHEEWQQCVVHRDIKSSNIMLDANFDVKLGDFGLATLIEHGNATQELTLAGTYGYMAPEYLATGKASKESDIYSFGIVALEIATGRRPSMSIMDDVLGSPKMLVQWVWDLYGIGELVSAVDVRLGLEFDATEAENLMLVGLWCAHPDYKLRPSIKQVIQVLDFQASFPTLPDRMPVPNYHMNVLNLPNNRSSSPSMAITSLEVGR